MDSNTALAAALAAMAPILCAALGIWFFRRRRRDEIYVGITPGELPALGQQVTVRRVDRPGTAWSGPVAVRFTPPEGLSPGLLGTVIDGRADAVDVSAMLIDLAVRGHLRLAAVPADADAPPPPARDGRPSPAPTPPHDWQLIRLDRPSGDAVLPVEEALLGAVFAHGSPVTIGELRQRGFDLTMRQAQIGLYREVVTRGWYGRHPRDRNRRLGCLGVPLGLIGAALIAVPAVQIGRDWATASSQAQVMLAAGAGLLVAALILLRGGRGRTPRTAAGSAVRIQALGFREYLATAEAGQIRFEEAAGLFSRYLPYAMVFGVADRWARTFAQVARSAQRDTLAAAVFDLGWIDPVLAVGDFARLGTGAIEAIPDLSPLSDIGDLDLFGEMGDVLGSVTEGAGDFASRMSDLLDFDIPGCDGCDLGW